jgi:AcrR family transcriptional regulator
MNPKEEGMGNGRDGVNPSRSQTRGAGPGQGSGDEGDTARRLIQAGRKLFATRGFDGTSVRALTAEAGTNLGAVTYHFESKEELYRRVLEEVIGPIRDHAEMLRGMPLSAPQRLEFFIRGMFQHLRENPDMPRFFVQEVVLGEEPAPPILETLRVVVTVLTGIVQEGQAVGTLRAGDPVLMALSTLSQPIYLSLMPRVMEREDLRAAGLPRPRSSPEEHAVDFVLRGLRAKEEEE